MARREGTERLRLLEPGLGRQMFILFVGCALAPILVLSILSWERVGRELEDQSRIRLHHVAQQTGMLLLDRLASTGAMLSDSGARPQVGTNERLSSLQRVGPGSAKPVMQPGPDPTRPHLMTVDNGSTPEVWLRSPSPSGQGDWVARLDPAFLFDISHENVLPPAGEACIVTSEGQVVFSSHPNLRCAPSSGPRMGSPELSSRSVAGEEYLALEWLLPLDVAFQTSGWTVVVAEPRSLVMAPVYTLLVLALLVSAFTLSGVAFLSARQIRRQLAPLERLQLAADRVRSGQLGVSVPVDSQDELGRVSAAFNQMSNYLAAQFASLESLIEMDRVILSATTRDELMSATLDATARIGNSSEVGLAMPAAFHVVGDDWNIVRRSAGRSDIVLEFPRWLLTSTDWYDDTKSVMVVSTADLEPELRRAMGGECDVVEIYPLTAEGRCLGVVVRESRSDALLADTSSLHLRQLCDQIASAVQGLSLRVENEQLRSFDSLTGLPNMAAHERALAGAMAQSPGQPLSVIRISVTGMARYANTYGQEGSERVLRAVADTLTSNGDFQPARVDSVSFGAFFRASDMDAIITRIRHVSGQVRSTLDGFAGSHGLGVAIGAGLQGLDSVDARDLISKAEVAGRHAVATGVDSVEFFSDSMERTFRKASDIESSLERAIEEDQLRLEYQAIVDAQTRCVVGAEALVRWTCPERGIVPPDVFIPIAEESGLIQRVGEWVLRQAFADVGTWRNAGLVPGRISINVSAFQVTRSLCDLIADLLQAGPARPEDFGVELTESDMLVESDGAQLVLQRIREMGLTISIDDFGTGYSSLDYLRRFQVDVVKIDRSFLQGVPEIGGSCDLTRAAIAVGKALGLRTIAEGCETEEQLQFLREAQCDSVQGWLFGASMSAEDFAKRLADENQASLALDRI